ncbi:hypothetical protein [Streptomyces pini]|uniref:Uncharacterized protein n=1 Tax=Streptomyces pini TaxID=1520580 RepID=A0A1I4EKX5_9ACTN|nr:hypothetical protein [Streptomyces pini]SFL04821.1 hypothetical protein SAMN05192584_11267 [Streptomyces pini]
MTNREFSQVVQGPMTPDGPSVDDLRAQMHGGQVAGRFFTSGDAGRVHTATVTNGQSEDGDGTVTDEEMARYRRVATHQGRREAPDERSHVLSRDPLTGQMVRTYADGTTEAVDEQARRAARRGED